MAHYLCSILIDYSTLFLCCVDMYGVYGIYTHYSSLNMVERKEI